MEMKTAAKDLTAVLGITIKNGDAVLFTKDCDVANTGSWYLGDKDNPTQHKFYIGELPVSDNLTLEIKVKSTTKSYAGNYGDLAFHGANQFGNIIPNGNGSYIDLKNGTHSGAQYENDNTNVGYITNGTYSIYKAWNNEDMYADMKMDIYWFQNAGQVKVTVTDLLTGVQEAQQIFEVTGIDNNKVCSISEPIMKGPKEIRLDYISSSTSWIMNYKNLQFVKRAAYSSSDVLTLKSLTVDGFALPDEGVAALKENGGTYTFKGNTYTSIPTVSAVMSNLGEATVLSSAVTDGRVTYTIKSTNYESILIVEGINIYTKQATDQSVQLKYTSEGKYDSGNWGNDLYYLLSSSLDGWNNSSFKLNATDYTIDIPSNIRVKQLIFRSLSNNYEGEASISAVSSEGATVILPTKRTAIKGETYDMIVNIEGHQVGKDITFKIVKEGQPTAWLELIVEETKDGNPGLSSHKTTIENNHAVIKLVFDREMGNGTTTTFNGQTYTADGGSSVLYFQLWNLEYNKDYTFTIAKDNVKDKYGNAASKDVAVNFSTGNAPTVTMACYDYVVSNVDELNAAIAELKTTNKSASATRKTVFLKNGEYTYGTLTGSYQHNISFDKICNVSLIGESKEGVIISGTTDGITSSTIDLSEGTGNYLQDITIRNNYDFRAETLKGVSVAVNGGNKTILKNVALQASQDTYVTGKRTYLEDCDIYGTTDFICGGGDIFLQRCNLILGNKSGACIAAPSTSSGNKWGYVFQNCVVRADEGATLVTDKSWNLGRPWQNEPRAYFLNTKMNVLCSDNGWTSMGSLPTHFYEYNSTDKNGNAIDLSTRKNSPTSTNSYSPVLSDEEALKFTHRNVLGGTDSWEVLDYTKQCEAPADVKIKGTSLQWSAVNNALCYVVLKDGKYLANITATSYDISEAGTYSVRAANEMGGLGTQSADVEVATLSITVNSGKWASFTPAVDCYMQTGATAYIITSVSEANSTAQAKKVETLEAGKGYFVRGETASATYTVYPTTATPDATTDNMIVGCLEATEIIGSGNTKYVLGEKDGQAGLFYLKETGKATVPAGKAYLEVPTTIINARTLRIICEDEATNSIVNVSEDGDQAVRKTVVDGKVVIITPKGSYNAVGTRVNEFQR